VTLAFSIAALVELLGGFSCWCMVAVFRDTP
jgi:drug/metabolite transporter superfamily protein YnfA